MRYLFISGTDFKNRKLTGAHKRFVELVNSFAERNTVHLIAYPYEGFNQSNIIYHKLTQAKGKKLPNHISEFFTLTDALNKYRTTIEYDFAIAFGAMPAICYACCGYKNIVTLFREDLIGYQKAVNASKIKIMYFKIQERIAVKHSQLIIVQCKHDRDAIINRNKKAKDKIYIQGNNINTSWMPRKETKAESTRDYPNILFIGNFSSVRKGHQNLLPAIAKLLDEGIRLELYILGEGKERQKYMDIYKKYPEFHFIGYANDVNAYLDICDIDIVPSIIDSCPNTVLEGIKAGLAVYGSNSGGIPDILKDASYMFEPNECDIFNFLKDKIENKKYIDDKKEQAILRENLTFDWGKSIETIINSRG